jgi:two-component system sensor kinase FixL
LENHYHIVTKEKFDILKEQGTQRYLDIAGVIIVALDRNGEITLINKRGCEILGYREDELLHRNWFEVCVPKKDRQARKKTFAKFLSDTGEVVEYNDNMVITKSGLQRVIAWHDVIIRDEQGNPTGTLSSGEDITERRMAEEAVHEREERIRAIVETAVDGIITINDHGIVESMNSAVERLFGYMRTEVIGNNITLLMPSPYQEEHDTYIHNYLNSGEKKIIGIGRETVGRKKDGTIFPINLSVSEFFVGKHRMFTGIVHDLTEQKHLQEQIIRSERLAIIGKMAAKVAHEVRNPLSSISLNAELLEDEIENLESDNNHEAKSLIKSMIREIDRVTSLTDEYLQFSRLPESQPVKGSFNDLVAEIIEFMGTEFTQNSIEFEYLKSTSPFAVRIDRTQIRRALLNIVRNAVESMPRGGKLTIWTEQNRRFGIINIQDTGFGIPADKVQHIFDPFFTTKDFGTGLGLAITRQIIDEHGGRISCKSKVTEGTTFRLELPLHENQ